MDIIKNNIFFVAVLLIVIGGAVYLFTNKTNTSDSVAPPAATIHEDTDLVLGSNEAKVTIHQYSDFLCPSCSKFSTEVKPEIIKNYVDKNQVRYVFTPLANINQDSSLAAAGLYCAKDQNKTWEYMHEAYSQVWNNYFSKGVDPGQVPTFKISPIKQMAAKIGLNSSLFNSCLDSGKYALTIKTATQQAQKDGVEGTPYFTINNQSIEGYASYNVLEKAIKSNL